MAWKKLRHGVAVNFPSPRKKTRQSLTNENVPIKFYKIGKNNSIFILFLQNKGVSLQRNSKQQPLAVSHWPLAKQRNTNQKLNIKHNAQIKSAQPSNMTHKDKASDKTRSRRRIAAGSWTRGKKGKNKNGVWKDAERQRLRGLKSPSVLKSPVFQTAL